MLTTCTEITEIYRNKLIHEYIQKLKNKKVNNKDLH